MKRKNIVLLIFVMSLLVLASCGQSKKTDEAPSTAPDKKQVEAPKEEKKEVKEITPRELNRNLNARKAMGLSIDKSYIEEVILNDGSNAADYFVAKGLAFDKDGVDFRAKYPDGFLPTNKELAKEHWAKAKEELGFDKITVELLAYDIERYKRMAEYVQGQLQENLEGLTVNINIQPFKNKLIMMRAHEYDIDIAGWGPDYADPMTFLDLWVQTSGHNSAAYKNDEYDAIIESAKTGELALNPKKRWEALQEAEKMLVERDATLFPLYQAGKVSLERKDITGLVYSRLSPEFTFKYADTSKLIDGKKIIRMTDNSDLPLMDQAIATDTISFTVMGNVLEGLVMIAEDDKKVPGVAESWEVSEDGKTYTFKLRKDSVWSNGTPVTAHDFEFAWKRIADPKTGSSYQFMIETAAIKNAKAVMSGEMPKSELGVKAADDHTLVVELDVPVAFFIELMTFPTFYPMNEAFVTEKGDKFGTSVDNTIYNGPFKLKTWEFGYEYSFDKNPSYWNASEVKIDEVNYRVVKDTAAAVNLFETGEADFCKLTGEFVETYMDHPDFVPRTRGSIVYLKFCQADDPRK